MFRATSRWKGWLYQVKFSKLYLFIFNWLLYIYSLTTSYPYIETPILALHSSTDSTIRFCYENESDTDFWQKWKDELAGIGREMAAAKPDDIGLFLVNCKFHGASGYYYDNVEVALLDSGNPDDKMLMKDVIFNFISETHPFQAIDDMSEKNPKCQHF